MSDLVNLARERAKRAAKAIVEPVIAQWKCRISTCITRVGVTQTAFDTLEYFNGILHARGERPIDNDEVMFCASCARRREP